MNKATIRNFAVWARNKLMTDISYHAGLCGITKNNILKALPQSTKDVEFYDVGTAEPYAIYGEEIRQRKSLVDAICKKGKEADYETAYGRVMEEVAYTWFNRLIAIRFMEVNDYLPAHIRVLSSENGKQEPDIVTTPFDAELFFAEGEQQEIIQMKNDNKLDELFRILFIKQCRELSRILPRLFEGTNDYTELLLSLSFIDREGVVYHLIHDIPEDDFNVEKGGQVEIIGWLYQYYNAELKDETFALLKNNVKVTKERIPSATQLFTPDWIVRYMVENSLGRLWVEGHPNAMLKSGWKYYLEEAEQEARVKEDLEQIRSEYAKLNPEDIRVIDPCMGSGHILVYAFDVLMQIYVSAGYTKRDAAKSILEHNLFGLDIDDRAAQLAYFAVMMKARQYNRRILDGETNCNVYAIKESNSFDREALVKLGDDLRPVAERLLDAFADAKEYGSIITVDVTLEELDSLDKRLDDVDKMSDYGNLLDMMYAGILCTELDDLIKQACVMVQKYDAVITNPPYMGAGNMNDKLSAYIKKKYPDSKSDISTVLMEACLSMSKQSGYMAMINIPVWMFLSSYEKLREKLVTSNTFISLIHPGRGIFGSDFGTVAFVIGKKHIQYYAGTYRRLFDKQGDVEPNEIREKAFLEGKGIYIKQQDDYKGIPGKPIAYWISDALLKAFSEKKAKDYGRQCLGMRTGDNERFLRTWQEVNYQDVELFCHSREQAMDSGKKWFPYNKGGEFRKWYGNLWNVVNWFNDGEEIKTLVRKVYPQLGDNLGWKISNEDKYFHKGIAWSRISSSFFGVRVCDDNIIFDTNAPMMFSNDELYLDYFAGLLTSKVATEFLKVINPTISFQVGDVAEIPIIVDDLKKEKIDNLVEENIALSRTDWDSNEISWNFKKHPLV